MEKKDIEFSDLSEKEKALKICELRFFEIAKDEKKTNKEKEEALTKLYLCNRPTGFLEVFFDYMDEKHLGLKEEKK